MVDRPLMSELSRCSCYRQSAHSSSLKLHHPRSHLWHLLPAVWWTAWGEGESLAGTSHSKAVLRGSRQLGIRSSLEELQLLELLVLNALQADVVRVHSGPANEGVVSHCHAGELDLAHHRSAVQGRLSAQDGVRHSRGPLADLVDA